MAATTNIKEILFRPILKAYAHLDLAHYVETVSSILANSKTTFMVLLMLNTKIKACSTAGLYLHLQEFVDSEYELIQTAMFIKGSV